jgi:hypothetical protein
VLAQVHAALPVPGLLRNLAEVVPRSHTPHRARGLSDNY